MGDSYANSGTGGNGLTGGRDKSTLRTEMPPIGTTPVKKYIPDGLKQKDLVGMPWRVAFALQADGWWLRSDIIWSKPNSMPESVTDRPTKAHEYIFLLAKSKKYFYNADAIKEPASLDSHMRYARGRSDTHKYADGGPGNQTIAKTFQHMDKPYGWHNSDHYAGQWAGRGEGKNSRMHYDRDPNHPTGKKNRLAGVNPKAVAPGSGIKQNESFSHAVKDLVGFRNKRTVWEIPSQPYSEAHFATFPEALAEPCIKAGSRIGDIVLDPFCGSGTTGLVALDLDRSFVGIELNPKYVEMAKMRITSREPLFRCHE